jgi:hypothetical protein
MRLGIVLTAAAAAVLVSALTKSRQRNAEGVSDKVYAGRDPVGVLANNLKAATKNVDNSAARVEVALKPLMAA